jgi:hypothetical protein
MLLSHGCSAAAVIILAALSSRPNFANYQKPEFQPENERMSAATKERLPHGAPSASIHSCFPTTLSITFLRYPTFINSLLRLSRTHAGPDVLLPYFFWAPARSTIFSRRRTRTMPALPSRTGPAQLQYAVVSCFQPRCLLATNHETRWFDKVGKGNRSQCYVVSAHPLGTLVLCVDPSVSGQLPTFPKASRIRREEYSWGISSPGAPANTSKSVNLHFRHRRFLMWLAW